jgi:hypothetical protein
LAEIIILLNALGLKYTIDWDYVYEHTQHIKFLKILNEIQN